MTLSKTHTGFSLLETLVAIAILTLAIAGPLGLVSQGITASIYAKDEITAMYLAGEGVEAVRNMRDSNVLAGAPWLQGLAACETQDCDVLLNPSTGEFTVGLCPGGDCLLNYDSQTISYNHATPQGTNQPSRFKRVIRLSNVPNNANEEKVEVTVTWTSTRYSRSVTVRENILNWQ